MMKAVRPVLASLLAIGVLGASTVTPARGGPAPNPAKVAELKMTLRDLYVGHIFWVRSLVMSTRLGEKGAAKEADEYAVKNAKAIGQSIGPVYGQAAGEKFATLFVGHYSAVKDYMNAAFANNFKGSDARKKAAVDKLTKNATDIATFLSTANPNLPKGTVYGLLVAHAQQHIKSIDATAKKAWDVEADMWDPMVKHIYVITDAVADAVAKQYPDKFQ
jgi:hypothetical protein